MGKRNREAYDSQVLKVHGTARGEIKAGCRQREGLCMDCFGVSGLRLDRSIQTKKSGALVNFAGASCKRRPGVGPGQQGDVLTTRATGESHQELHLL